jgi:hypothetical protein
MMDTLTCPPCGSIRLARWSQNDCVRSAVGLAISHATEDASSFDLTGKALLLERTIWYAGRTAQALNFSSLSKRLASYQQLVLISTCCVLVKHGIPNENLFNITRQRKHLRRQNLDRLLSGGFFLNMLVNRLCWLGWGEQAHGLPLLCMCHISSLILILLI